MSISNSDVTQFVEENIEEFHSRRLKSLESLKLSKVLSRKNPYLFKAKNVLTAGEIVKGLLDAHLSSQEEAIFGEFLEQLAIFIVSKVFSGRKSAVEGIDFEFVRDGKLNLVTMKSGPNWGNSGQISKMKECFSKAKRVARTSGSKLEVVAINGCSYGREATPDKGDYLKYCGQEFWTYISNNPNLYLEIIEPLGYKAKEKNDTFTLSYTRIVNIFTQEFMNSFCVDGIINWEKLVMFNSEVKQVRVKTKKD